MICTNFLKHAVCQHWNSECVERLVHKQQIRNTAKEVDNFIFSFNPLLIPGYTLLADLCIEMLKQLEEDQSTQHEDPTHR